MDTLTLPFSIKSLSEEGHVEGLISAFGSVDAYGDTIKHGAYAKSLAQLKESGRKLPLLYQHDPHRPIGVWNDLAETAAGLAGKAKLTMAIRDAQEAYALAKDGALTGISIGYNIPPGGAVQEGRKRVLTEIDLLEASLVTFPADPLARVRVVKAVASVRDLEEVLQQAGGLSGRKAKAAAAAAWRAIGDTENDDAAAAELAAILEGSAARIAAL